MTLGRKVTSQWHDLCASNLISEIIWSQSLRGEAQWLDDSLSRVQGGRLQHQGTVDAKELVPVKATAARRSQIRGLQVPEDQEGLGIHDSGRRKTLLEECRLSISRHLEHSSLCNLKPLIPRMLFCECARSNQKLGESTERDYVPLPWRKAQKIDGKNLWVKTQHTVKQYFIWNYFFFLGQIS